MKGFYKRKICLILIFVFLFSFICGCGDDTEKEVEQEPPYFSVKFIDVGEGDSILIAFPDGKVMLIDTGDANSVVENKVVESIREYSDKIDYLVLTHVDSDHIGNANKIIEEFDIGRAYIPYVLTPECFPLFNSVKVKLESKCQDIVNSEYLLTIFGEDYFVLFLAPASRKVKNSPYKDFNSTATPTTTERNNVSPIIYAECKGVRFLFTGDAESGAEKAVVDYYRINYYSHVLGDRKLNLENIDFLKVSHHGADDASCSEFLDLLKPKNAVISVGGNNYSGHPSSATLLRLQYANGSYNLWRTDTDGDITVNVDDSGKSKIFTSM